LCNIYYKYVYIIIIIIIIINQAKYMNFWN